MHPNVTVTSSNSVKYPVDSLQKNDGSVKLTVMMVQGIVNFKEIIGQVIQ
jgi:hypothetical protein